MMSADTKAALWPELSPPSRPALRELYGRVERGMRLGLDAMREACARADHPELSFEVAHIAGTNGKGSTCAMIESMARAAGKTTGLYTSPHLCRFAERVRVNGEPIDDEMLDDALARALEIGPHLTFFETATLAAFLVFRDINVDVAILETGIGGRLDATNVVQKPRVTAITGIALDHTDRLGRTLEEIAREKAGIAKHGVPMVLGPMAPSVRAAALEVTLAARALPIVMGTDPDGDPNEHAPSLLDGPYQRNNARIASRVARELGINETMRRTGLMTATWPGRFERIEVQRGPHRGRWILDGAHNPDGAQALAAALQETRDGKAPGAIIFGALADKAWPEMLHHLAQVRCPRVFVAPRGRDATEPATLARYDAGLVATSLPEAMHIARSAAADLEAPVVVCGSLYLVGEARALLLGLPSDPPVGL